MGRVGNISIHDIREGLNQIGVYPTGEEVELFMTRYDRTNDRRLTFAEFSEAFLSLDPYYSKMVSRRPANPTRGTLYRRDECFLADTQIEFRSIWRTHFKVECASETLRQKLSNRPMFNLYEAFNSLDINEDGRISIDEIRRLIESRGYFITEKDVTPVLEKFDRDRDGTVSYHEFRQEMVPKSPNRRV